MKNTDHKSEELESTLGNLLTRFTALPKADSGRLLGGGVPRELRRDMISARSASGETLEGFARRFGITGTTIRNWERQIAVKKPAASAKPVVKTGKPKKPSFKPVRVVPESEAPGPERRPVHESRALCIELASGARITGLNFDDIRKLIIQDGGAK